MGQKASDLDTLPMCRLHHDEQHRIGWPQFIRTYQLDVQWWLNELRLKPRIDVMTAVPPARYSMFYRGDQYYLLPVSAGFQSSWALAIDLCREVLIAEVFGKRKAA